MKKNGVFTDTPEEVDEAPGTTGEERIVRVTVSYEEILEHWRRIREGTYPKRKVVFTDAPEGVDEAIMTGEDVTHLFPFPKELIEMEAAQLKATGADSRRMATTSARRSSELSSVPG